MHLGVHNLVVNQVQSTLVYDKNDSNIHIYIFDVVSSD